MKKETVPTPKGNEGKYAKLVKALQIASGVFMLAMVVLCVALMKKHNVSIKNAAQLKDYLQGSIPAVAGILIGFSVVKSFALVFPPAILFALSGVVFENYFLAVGVNIVATALSLALPYIMGRFTGRDMVRSLSARFPKIKKLDDFAGENDFIVVFVFKAGGFLPSDLSSLIFGALDIPFGKYFLAANLGMLPLNFLWTLLGNKGDLSNPLSFLYVLPILLFAVGAAVFMKKRGAKQAKQAEDTKAAEDDPV